MVGDVADAFGITNGGATELLDEESHEGRSYQ